MSDLSRKTRATPTPPSEVRGIESTRKAAIIEITINGVRVEMSPELEAIVHRMREGLLGQMPKEMTTTQAAEFLDVSRPFVVKLITRGELPCRMVGTHRRIPSGAVLAYREKMFHQARNAADEITRLAQDAGLYDEKPPRKAQ